MKKSGFAVAGGWLVALAAVAVAVAVRTKRADSAATQKTAVRTPAAAPARKAAEAKTPPAAESKPAQDAQAERAAAPAEEPGADWSLPDYDPDSPEAVFAQLRNAPADVKALAEAIMADIKEGGADGSLELVQKAAKCRNAKAQVLALFLLDKCIDRARGDGAADPGSAYELVSAAHDFYTSENEVVLAMSRERFCLAAALDGKDANRREYAKTVLCDWAVSIDEAAAQQLMPSRYAYRDNYQYAGKADLAEWARMYAGVVESAPDKASAETAREAYRIVTQTAYTTREDAEAWCARRAELKEQGAREHAGDPDFDAEAWATQVEDEERKEAK